MNALSPAKVQRVTIVDDKEKVMEVVVEDSQLSLAIGKKGQNVRLAAKLTGWRIDIKSEEEKRKEVEEQFGALGGEEPPAEGAGGESEPVEGEPGGVPGGEGASVDELSVETAGADESNVETVSAGEANVEAEETPAEMETEKS
jgi:predicted PilT family ATPase